jgi:hypothetical protein
MVLEEERLLMQRITSRSLGRSAVLVFPSWVCRYLLHLLELGSQGSLWVSVEMGIPDVLF